MALCLELTVRLVHTATNPQEVAVIWYYAAAEKPNISRPDHHLQEFWDSLLKSFRGLEEFLA